MLSPTTDSARKAMLETIVHGIVSVAVVASSTVLAAVHAIDQTAWAAAIGAGIAASGAVSVLQGKATNGHITDEAIAQLQRPGGMRRTDPSIKRSEVVDNGS
jgi:hypothetical protein